MMHGSASVKCGSGERMHMCWWERSYRLSSQDSGQMRPKGILKQQHSEDEIGNLWISFYGGTCAKEDRQEVVRTAGLIAREK